MMLVSEGEGLHQLPAGEVRHAGVADLALLDEHLECLKDLLDRRVRVVSVQLE